MLDVVTVSFFGHRQIDRFFDAEEKVAAVVRRLITEKEYVKLLIGRDGEFDQIVSSTVKRTKRDIRDDNSELTWVMVYPKSAYSAQLLMNSFLMNCNSVGPLAENQRQ